jgi:hypothetical protein
LYKVLRENNRSTKYFTYEEQIETLNKEKIPIGNSLYLKVEKRTPYTYKNGSVYDGEWRGGMKHGFGIMKWIDGAKYEGEWQDNRACGKGKFIYVDGDIYEGNWYNDKANGLGVYKHYNGAKYEGNWYNDA